MHHRDSFQRVVTLGRLTRQHHTVGAIENGIGHVGDLGSSRTGLLDHALQHLSGADDRLAGNVALGNHHLLRQKDLLGRNLNAHVTAGHHEAVTLANDLVNLLDALVVLHLGDDLNVGAIVLLQNLANLLDAVAVANEGGKDHVHLVLAAKHQILLVLLGDGGQIDKSAGQVDALLRAQSAAILNHADKVVGSWKKCVMI